MKSKENDLIIIESEEHDLQSFLEEKLTPTSNFISQHQLLDSSLSDDTADPLIRCARNALESGASTNIEMFNIHMPIKYPGMGGMTPELLTVISNYIQQTFTIPLSLICVGGGYKLVVELLKLWVADRTGRKLKVKKGDVEIEIQGAIDPEQIEQLTEMLKTSFEPSKIIEP
jgi:hypothetical protein